MIERKGWKNYMREYLNVLKYAIYAGIMISFGGMVYLACENKVIGAFLFSFGLLTIVNQKFNLYTGKIGFAKTKGDFLNILFILAGNVIGTGVMALIYRLTICDVEMLNALWAAKLQKGPFAFFLLSVLCGVMMYLAIDNYQRNNQLLFIILPVMIFILSGFEHSVANMFYFFSSSIRNMESILWLLISILGNGVGALLYDFFKRGH